MGKKLRANIKFGFEDLEVWQKADNFADKAIDIGDKLNNTNKNTIGWLSHWNHRQPL